MLMIKYVILFLIFSSVSLIGNLVSKKYKNRVRELYDFKEFCNILESKIKFTYEPLGEILKDTSKIMENNYILSNILKNTSEKLKQVDFKTAWEQEIEEEKKELNLIDEDINVIKGLGNMLGKTDVDGNISEIDLTMDFLDTQIKSAENECKKNEKMYRSLGTILGLAIVIILI